MPSRTSTPRDFLLLHAVVFIWGLTAVLGKGIDLPSTTLVAWRTGIAAIGLAVWIRWHGKKFWPGKKHALRMFAVGMMIGFHWFLFFLAGKLGEVSIALIGVATSTLWCALLEPLFNKGKRLGLMEFTLAVLVVVGAAVIGYGNPVSWKCLGVGVAAAAVAALFSYLNNALVKDQDQSVITFYEMIGACFLMSILTVTETNTRIIPTGWEWLWLLILSLLCTVWAFTVYIGLLRKISVYVISLVSNLEPVWGILLAAIVLGEYKDLNGWFWLGGAIVIGSIACYPVWMRWKRNRSVAALGQDR